MSDKLEECKRAIDAMIFYNEMLPEDEDMLYWLLEQAERVQELEEDNKNLQVLSSINRKEHMRIHEQNKRYREAIEYVINAKVNQYASVENIINDIKFVLSEALESESDE